jgi:tRNA-dihydrouridine synthase A
MLVLQVLEQYSVYGDSMLGRWGRRPDGALQPGVRSIVIPILGMFHGQPGARRWRQAIDQELRTATSVSAVIQVRSLGKK